MPNPEEFYPSNIIFQKLNENKWIAYDNNLGFPEFTGPSKKEVYNKIKEYKNGLNDSFKSILEFEHLDTLDNKIIKENPKLTPYSSQKIIHNLFHLLRIIYNGQDHENGMVSSADEILDVLHYYLEGKVKSNNSLEYANLQIELSRTDTILDFGITFYLEFTEAGKIEFSVSF